MTSVDEFVRTNILTFPSLFPNRTAVLHHALCVIGNGYKWNKKGEIVSDFHRPVPLWNEERELEEFDTKMKARFPNKFIRSILSQEEHKHIEECAKVVREVELRIHERGVIDSFYPQCAEYALLMNIPPNVTADWAEACEEMKQLAEKAGWKF